MKGPSPSSAADKASTAARSITVLVADDHPVVREGVATMVRQQADLRVVAEAADGVEAVAAWERHRPDVAVLDLRMPLLDGADATARIRRLDPHARIVILTTYEDEESLFRAMQAGARSYLLKDAPRTELLDCVRTVARGGFCISGDLARKLAARVAQPDLTAREREVLGLAGEGRSNKEIATALAIGDGTVKAHLKHIFGKLDALSRTEAVGIAHRRGLIKL